MCSHATANLDSDPIGSRIGCSLLPLQAQGPAGQWSLAKSCRRRDGIRAAFVLKAGTATSTTAVPAFEAQAQEDFSNGILGVFSTSYWPQVISIVTIPMAAEDSMLCLNDDKPRQT